MEAFIYATLDAPKIAMNYTRRVRCHSNCAHPFGYAVEGIGKASKPQMVSELDEAGPKSGMRIPKVVTYLH